MALADAVIPVAGLGTRLLPATKSQPKEMLPVVDKPVVQRVVEELAAAGVERVLFVTGRRKRAIEDHFDDDPELAGVAAAHGTAAGLRILYTRQPRPRGLGDALACADGFAAGRPVIVALGDVLIDPVAPDGVVPRLVEAFEGSDADAALAVETVAREAVSRYGIVAPADDDAGTGAIAVRDVVEKPDPSTAPSRLAVAARYVLGPAVFAALRATAPDAGGEVQLADALRALIAGGGRVVAVPLRDGERRFDVGTIEGYCETFVEFALRDPRTGPALRRRLAT